MELPTQSQIYAGLRYAGVASGVVMTGLAGLGALSPDAAHDIVTQIQLVADDLQKTIGDSWKLILLVSPVVTFWFAKMGWNSASTKHQIAAVQSLPAAQVNVTDPKLAEGIPGVQVVPK
jgi:hypothetical protein